MNATTRPSHGGTLALGAILITTGLLAVIGRVAGVDLETLVGEQTWPWLVIVPGIVLLGLTLTVKPPDGVGFVIAGSIVTTVGAILLYQATTELWESWAYVWVLIPGAAGLGMAVYGLLTGIGDLVTKGTRMTIISGVLFVIGWWWFETLFRTGEVPVDAGSWWPIVAIGVGILIASRALWATRQEGTQP